MTFLLTLILGISIGAVSVLGWYKHWCRSRNKSEGTDNKDSFAVSQKYDDIEAPDLFTDNNPSYKHVQRSSDDQNKDSSSKKKSTVSYPLYEDPDQFLQVKMDTVTKTSETSISTASDC